MTDGAAVRRRSAMVARLAADARSPASGRRNSSPRYPRIAGACASPSHGYAGSACEGRKRHSSRVPSLSSDDSWRSPFGQGGFFDRRLLISIDQRSDHLAFGGVVGGVILL